MSTEPITDDRLQELELAECLCVDCEPGITAEARAMATELRALRPTPDERLQIAGLRREWIANDYPAACAWIDRYLAAMGEP